MLNVVYNTDSDNINEDILYGVFADIIKTIQSQEEDTENEE